MVHQVVLLCFVGVLFESVLCSPLDVHRIVLKTHRRTRDRDHHKSHSDHRYTRKPPVHDSQEDEWYPVTTRRPHHSFNSYRSHHETESSRYSRKPLSRSTPKPVNLAELVELTTSYPEKLPVPVIESIYSSFQISNNSLDLYPAPQPTHNYNFNYKGKVRQHREKEATTPKIPSKGYEVYEEIIGDLIPPPQPRLNYNIPSVPILNTPLPIIVVQDEDNHIKENVTEVVETKNKTYGRRTKARRNRGNTRFDEVKSVPDATAGTTKVTIKR